MNIRPYSRPQSKRAFAVIVLHALVFALAYWLAFGIRGGFAISPQDWVTLWVTVPAVVIIQLFIFDIAGHCHGPWHRVSISDLISLFQAATVSLLLIVALDLLLMRGHHVPRGVLLLDWGIIILLLGELRIGWMIYCRRFRLVN